MLFPLEKKETVTHTRVYELPYAEESLEPRQGENSDIRLKRLFSSATAMSSTIGGEGTMSTETGTETGEGFPTALIQKIRSQLVDMAGGLGRSGSTPSPLPTLDYVIANAGSPTPFRCGKCNATLLLGSNSQICAACGTWRNVAFDISFASTLAYQYLMDSFQHHGSPEVVSARSTTNTEVANVWTLLTAQKDALIAHDISSLGLKWPEDKSVRSSERTSELPTATSNTPYRVEVDLEDFFGQSKPKASNVSKEIVTPREEIREAECHASDDIVPQLSVNDNHVDILCSVLSRQTHVDTKDDDPFLSWDGDLKVANPAVEIAVPKSADPHTALSAGSSLHFMEANKELSLAINSQSTINSKDLFGDPANDVKNVISMQESWIQDDPWSAVITKELHTGSSKKLIENSKSLSDWQDAYCWADNIDPLSGSTWQQGDILQRGELTEVMSENHNAGENGVTELDVHCESYPLSRSINLEKEAASAIGTFSEIDLSTRIGVKEVSERKQDAMSSSIIAMPQGSSNADSKQAVESLLSQMHHLSFMLAGHLVIPGGHIEH